jgi:hypothetical protein
MQCPRGAADIIYGFPGATGHRTCPAMPSRRPAIYRLFVSAQNCGAQIKAPSTTTSIQGITDVTGGSLAHCNRCLVSRLPRAHTHKLEIHLVGEGKLRVGVLDDGRARSTHRAAFWMTTAGNPRRLSDYPESCLTLPIDESNEHVRRPAIVSGSPLHAKRGCIEELHPRLHRLSLFLRTERFSS